MIVYDSRKWSDFIKIVFYSFWKSYNMKQLAKFILIVGVYSTIVTLAEIHYLEGAHGIDTVFFSLVGVILGLFLVFRLNSAYDRWWEGRKQWGKLVNDSRTLALNLDTLIPPDDKKRRRFFVKNISNFALALQWHLRNDIQHGKFIYINSRYSEDMESAKHVPNKIASYMMHELRNMETEGTINEFDKNRMANLIQGFIDVLGACERIKKTPIPFSHSTFIRLFTIIYIAILPFGLVEVFHYLTIPATIVMGFAMLGIEVISEEIEDPFGLDQNCLPTGAISDGIRESVYEILNVKSFFQEEERTDAHVEVQT